MVAMPSAIAPAALVMKLASTRLCSRNRSGMIALTIGPSPDSPNARAATPSVMPITLPDMPSPAVARDQKRILPART